MKKRTRNLTRRALAIFMSVMMCVSVLQLNASAWTITAAQKDEMELVCTKTEHTHNETCYFTNKEGVETPQTFCGLEAGAEIPHVHTAACGEERKEIKELICTDSTHHDHTTDVPQYTEVQETIQVPVDVPVLDEEGNPVLDEEGNPVMTQTVKEETITKQVEVPCEIEAEPHTEGCYKVIGTETVYTSCDGAPGQHEHTNECYKDPTNTHCGSEEHTHTAECYKPKALTDDEKKAKDEELTNTINQALGNKVDGKTDEDLIDKSDNDEKTIKLVLNGYTLELSTGIIVVGGKTLVILDGEIVGGTLVGTTNDQAVVEVQGNGTLKLEGETKLTHDQNGDGEADTTGSGVKVDEKGKFEMTGGEISGNKAGSDTHYNGGGVYVSGGTFEMSGGTITGNTAEYTPDTTADPTVTHQGAGGGVYVTGGKKNDGTSVHYDNDATNRGKFTLSGGAVISDNEAGEGGGIFIDNSGYNNTFTSQYGSKFIMNGGTVDGNLATRGEGGGIYIQGTGKITAGNITNNITMTGSDLGGGGIYIENSGRLELENAIITENTAAGIGGGIAGCIHGATSILGAEHGAAVFDNETGVWKDQDGNVVEAPEGANTPNRLPLDENNVNVVDGNEKWTDDMINGAKDIFSNGHETSSGNAMTVVGNTMLGGGQANWTGVSDGQEVNATNNGVVSSKEQIGLTANVSDADKKKAKEQGKVFISGNHSNMHGGGIGNNGILIIGSKENEVHTEGLATVEVPVNKELTGDREEDIQKGEFTFELLDSSLNKVSTADISTVQGNKGTANINIPMDAFKDKDGNLKDGKYVFYVREQPGNDPSIKYDNKMYRVEITITSETTTETFGLGKYGERKVTSTAYKVSNVTRTELSLVAAGIYTVVQGADQKDKVEFENEYKPTGSLTVTKNVVINGEGYRDEIKGPYTFIVTGPDGYSQQFTLAAGESHPMSNLPLGDYQVAEVYPGGTEHYDVNVTGLGTATVGKDQTAAVTVTNTYTRKRGNLEISKNLSFGTDSIPEGANGLVFNFQVTGPDDFTSQTVSVTAGGTAQLTNIPTGDYTITEVVDGRPEIENYHFVSVTGVGTQAVTKGETASVAVTNTYARDRGSLTIDKTVVGGPADASVSKVFRFTVTGPEGYRQDVSITGAGSVTLENLLTGDYTVAESFADASIPFYSLSVTGGGTATVVQNGNTTVGVTNTYTEEREEPTPTPEIPTPQPTPPEEEELPDPTPPLAPVETPEPTPPEEEELPDPTPPLSPDEPEEDLPDPTPPLSPDEPEEDLPDPTPPLSPDEPEEDLPEDTPPLADVPRTSDEPTFWYAMLVVSGGSLLALKLTGKRKKKSVR